MRRLAKGFVIAMLTWLWCIDIYAHGGGGGASLCQLPPRYCSATTALANCTKDLVRHPGGICYPVSAFCDVGPLPHSAFTIRYQGTNHHVYKFFPPFCPDEDGDGVADEWDPDDDNDGVNDADDRCPLERVAEGATDQDGDGCWTLPAVPTYHAGICPRNLAGLPFRIGRIRHDDFQSYKLLSGRRLDPSTSGFYADNISIAVLQAWIYIRFRVTIYSAGHHKHAITSTCTLPAVSKARFETLRSRAKEIIWTNYHLITRNCQHWAAKVAR